MKMMHSEDMASIPIPSELLISLFKLAGTGAEVLVQRLLLLTISRFCFFYIDFILDSLELVCK